MRKYIPVSGKVFGKKEINNAISAAKDGWWTEGRFAKQFEREFSRYMGVRYVSLTNSGSSANLLAIAALTSSVLGEKRLRAGDEVITCAVAFPTTVNPLFQYGLKPVFVDVLLDTLNIDVSQLEKAITKKTRAVMFAHTLGKPADLVRIMQLVRKYKLWFIEDCCDALGSRYNKKLVGTFGHIATFSFYPAHQITMGEGGAVVTNNPLIHRSIRQFRDWGRDCWCDTGKDNTCRKRFGWQMGELPHGYDHKYIYSQLGYNLKLTDFQAAIGVAQLDRLAGFIQKRKETYESLFSFFSSYQNYFLLMKKDRHESPSYFGFPFLVRPDAPFTRTQLTTYLEQNGIGTRTVFSGNLLRHPAYIPLKQQLRVVGTLKNADMVMQNACWIGVWPGITKADVTFMKQTIKRFLG